ncbi:MAG: coenzyme F420-0:L-glutamate ligase [Candidatus Taylorbacteria bacterium]
MKILPVKTRIFKEKENLTDFILEHIPHLSEGSVLAVTSKIVSLAEGRVEKKISEENKIRLIKQESELAFRTKYVWLTIRDNLIMSDAGIDESNADSKLILLPKNSFKSASLIREELKNKFRLKRLGVLITDSRLFPMRNGTVGVALSYAGFKGIKEYVGKKDLFGRPFKFQRVDIADSLATSAVLTMGEGNESIPLAVIEDAPITFTDKVNPRELQISIKEDVYQPLFEKIHTLKWKKRRD